MKYSDNYCFWIIYRNPFGYIKPNGECAICPGLARRFTDWEDVIAEWSKHDSCALFKFDGNRKTGREFCIDETHVVSKRNL